MQTITITADKTNNCSKSITDRVKTFEDACQELGICGNVFIASLHDALAIDNKAITAHIKLNVIARALNEGWIPDWENTSEYKYYPWFKMKGGFVLLSVDSYSSNSIVGSRLCFKNEALAKYAATQFADLYKDLYTL